MICIRLVCAYILFKGKMRRKILFLVKDLQVSLLNILLKRRDAIINQVLQRGVLHISLLNVRLEIKTSNQVHQRGALLRERKRNYFSQPSIVTFMMVLTIMHFMITSFIIHNRLTPQSTWESLGKSYLSSRIDGSP